MWAPRARGRRRLSAPPPPVAAAAGTASFGRGTQVDAIKAGNQPRRIGTARTARRLPPPPRPRATAHAALTLAPSLPAGRPPSAPRAARGRAPGTSSPIQSSAPPVQPESFGVLSAVSVHPSVLAVACS